MFIHSKTTVHHFSGTSWHSIFLYSNFWPLSTRTLINNKLPRPCSLLPHCQPASKVALLLASLMPTCHTTLLWWSSHNWGNSGTSGGGTLFGLEVSMGVFATPGLFYNLATATAPDCLRQSAHVLAPWSTRPTDPPSHHMPDTSRAGSELHRSGDPPLRDRRPTISTDKKDLLIWMRQNKSHTHNICKSTNKKHTYQLACRSAHGATKTEHIITTIITATYHIMLYNIRAYNDPKIHNVIK